MPQIGFHTPDGPEINLEQAMPDAFSVEPNGSTDVARDELITEEMVEAAARAICVARGSDPATLYQHYEHDDYPIDHTLFYKDVTTGLPREQILHFAWRNHVAPARAALEAVSSLHTARIPASITADAVAALKLAVGHIDHMSAWIAGQNVGYSLEGLGEDLPGIRAALSAAAHPSPQGEAGSARIEQLEQLVRSFVIDEIDYMTINHLGDPEQKHNIRWARRLGITDTPKEFQMRAWQEIEDDKRAADSMAEGYRKNAARTMDTVRTHPLGDAGDTEPGDLVEPDLWLCNAPAGVVSSGRSEASRENVQSYRDRGYTCEPYFSEASLSSLRAERDEWRRKYNRLTDLRDTEGGQYVMECEWEQRVVDLERERDRLEYVVGDLNTELATMTENRDFFMKEAHDESAAKTTAEMRVAALEGALKRCVAIVDHAVEHYKGAVATKMRREITVHVRAVLKSEV